MRKRNRNLNSAISFAILIGLSSFCHAAVHDFQWEVNPLNHLPYLSPGEKIKEFRIYWSLTLDNFSLYETLPVTDPDNPPTAGTITIPDQPTDIFFVLTALNSRGQESDPSNVVTASVTGNGVTGSGTASKGITSDSSTGITSDPSSVTGDSSSITGESSSGITGGGGFIQSFLLFLFQALKNGSGI